MVNSVRTDLASEAHRLWRASPEATSGLPGVRAGEEKILGFPVMAVEILDEEGAQALGKPLGRYYTMELPRVPGRGEEAFPDAVGALARLIRRCLPEREQGPFLVAALGNPDITPDSLGPLCAESVLVTRHLKARQPSLFHPFAPTAVCRTGVLGTSGMESALQIRALCRSLFPCCVIAVDALAGADADRLCRSVQVCSSGIAPGSGVGNDREQLDARSLGVPVVAIGIPTVIDASFFSGDESVRGLFVTPRGIDEQVRSGARLIGYAINLALHDGLTVDDVQALLS